MTAQRSEVCVEFFYGEPLGDVLGTVPVEGLNGDQNDALDDGVVSGIGEAPDQGGILFGGDDAGVAVDLQSAPVEVVRGDQGDPVVAGDIAGADVLQVAAEVGPADGVVVDDAQEPIGPPRNWT